MTNREDGTVTVHDPRTLAVKRRMSSKGFPIRVVFSADGALLAFVTNARAATLAVFNARTKVPVATVSLSRDDMTYQPVLGNAALPIGVVVAADRPRAYVAISGGDRIAVIDTQHWQVIDYWVTGREPDALGIVAN